MIGFSNDGQTTDVYLSGRGKTLLIQMSGTFVQSLIAFYHQRIYIAGNTFSIIYHSNSTFYSNLPNLDVSSCE